MTFGNLLFSCKGRIGRFTYFIAAAVLIALHAIAAAAFKRAGLSHLSPPPTAYAVAILVFVCVGGWMNYALAVKRFHDFGRSGWYAAILFFGPAVAGIIAALAGRAPAIQSVAFLFAFGLALYALWLTFLLFFKGGDPVNNEFGPPPAREAADPPALAGGRRDAGAAHSEPLRAPAAPAAAFAQQSGGFGRRGEFGRR